MNNSKSKSWKKTHRQRARKKRSTIKWDFSPEIWEFIKDLARSNGMPAKKFFKQKIFPLIVEKAKKVIEEHKSQGLDNPLNSPEGLRLNKIEFIEELGGLL